MSRLTQKHENEVELQDVREADGRADGFRQRDAEEFSLVKDGDGLYHSNGFMGLRDYNE